MEPAHVEIDLGFFPLMWILFLITPRISINGQEERRKWGKHVFTLPPGHYYIEASYPYFFRSKTSPGSIHLDLQPGGAYKLRYRPAWLVFLDGSMKLVDQPALPSATARQLPPA